MTLIDELGSLPERMKASQARVTDLREQLSNELKIRNGLVVQAIDQAGMSQADVARSLGVKQPQVTRILSNSSSD